MTADPEKLLADLEEEWGKRRPVGTCLFCEPVTGPQCPEDSAERRCGLPAGHDGGHGSCTYDHGDMQWWPPVTPQDWEAWLRATAAPAIAATVRTIARTAECQRCGARTGEPCRRPGGGRARDPHRTRIRTAHQEDPR